MNCKFKRGWRLFYDPLTFQSGLETVPKQTVYISSKSIYIGTMPIRKDVKVKYCDIKVDRFKFNLGWTSPCMLIHGIDGIAEVHSEPT